jgi:hypothetical protein
MSCEPATKNGSTIRSLASSRSLSAAAASSTVTSTDFASGVSFSRSGFPVACGNATTAAAAGKAMTSAPVLADFKAA